MSSWTSQLLVGLCLLSATNAFAPFASPLISLGGRVGHSHALRTFASTNPASQGQAQQQESEGLALASATRRGALRTAFGFGGALALSAAAAPHSALAADSAEDRIVGYGLKDTKKSPDGYKPVLEFYGRKRTADVDPLLVTYNAPNGWITVKPSINLNGEDGTISSGDYGKGDSAALFVGPLSVFEKGLNLENREAVSAVVYAGLTVKGESQVQGFKLTKVSKLETPTNQPYYLVAFKYTLLTGAGFAIDRIGVGSVTAVGKKSVQAMIGATTDIRFKKVGGNLQEIAESFRVYEGIKPPPLELVSI